MQGGFSYLALIHQSNMLKKTFEEDKHETCDLKEMIKLKPGKKKQNKGNGLELLKNRETGNGCGILYCLQTAVKKKKTNQERGNMELFK